MKNKSHQGHKANRCNHQNHKEDVAQAKVYSDAADSRQKVRSSWSEIVLEPKVYVICQNETKCNFQVY